MTKIRCSEPLNPPDLSKLMSEILSKGGQNQRLVFVEYDPVTRAFYNHVGMPEDEVLELSSEIDAASSCAKFLERIIEKSLNSFDKEEDAKLKILMKSFPKKIAERSKELLKYLYSHDIELVDHVLLGQIENRKTAERFLLCLARSHDGKGQEKEDDWKWLQSNKVYIDKHFHWLLQHTPQAVTDGITGEQKEHNWELVPNEPSDIEAFIVVAGLEFICKMRQPKGRKHFRRNLELDTGEYAGQVIAFMDKKEESNKDELQKSVVEAIDQLRHILPEIRQARYVDAILSGQSAGVLDHVLVKHLPHMIPLCQFYVRIINEKFQNWKGFFHDGDNQLQIYSHSPSTDSKFFGHFEPKSFIETDLSKEISKRIEKQEKELNGFIDYEKDPIIFTFFTEKSANNGIRIAVVAVLDNKIVNRASFNLKEPKEEIESSNECFRFFMTRLQTSLAVLLQPRHPLRMRLDQAQKAGKSYEEQFGKAIYGPGYLDLDDINKSDIESNFGRASSEVEIILGHVRNTKEKLVGTLYQPRGYRAIATVIFDEFFCQLWRNFLFLGDPTKLKSEENHTPLGRLVRVALNFEDTLQLEGGYREHFVHSYHVFLLGLHLMMKLHLVKGFNKKKVIKRLRAWFLTSMYHDIGYPIQKLETIAIQYLEKLRTGEQNCLDGDLAIDVNIGYGKLFSTGMLSTRLRSITDCFIRNLFPDDPTKAKYNTMREVQLTDLEEHLKIIDKDLDLKKYKEGLNHTFFQYCMHLALIYGEHGIVSALLFDGGARQNKFIDSSENENISIRETVSVSILSHHIFDNLGKWSFLDKPKEIIRAQWAFLAPHKKLQKGNSKEIAQSIGWDPAFFLYDLEEKDDCRSLSALLILCDCLAQWGRTDETRLQFICLRKREEKDPLVVLCYPEVKSEEAVTLCDYYRNQISSITGPDRANSDNERFVTLHFNAAEKRCTTAERCSECTQSLPRAEDKPNINPIMLTKSPQEFSRIETQHQDILDYKNELINKKKKQHR